MDVFVNKVVFGNEVLYSWEKLPCTLSGKKSKLFQEASHASTD